MSQPDDTASQQEDRNQPTADYAMTSESESWLGVASMFLEYRGKLVGIPLAIAALTVTVILLLPLKYTTVVSFTPAPSDTPLSAIASLAGQVGVNLGADPTVTPDYYASVLTTRALLQPIVEGRYTVQDGDSARTATYIQFLEIDKGDSGKTVEEAIKTLRETTLDVAIDRRSGIVAISAQTEWPELSLEIARRLLESLDRFNFESRQRQSVAERDFLGQRLDTARAELTAAEDRLVQFYEKNRSFQSDPALVAVQDRLQRDITLKTNVYSIVMQSFEQARMAAVNNTPSLLIVQQPQLALRFDRRNIALKAAAAFVAGFLGVLAWISLLAALGSARQRDRLAFEVLQRRYDETIADLRRLLWWRRGRTSR